MTPSYGLFMEPPILVLKSSQFKLYGNNVVQYLPPNFRVREKEENVDILVLLHVPIRDPYFVLVKDPPFFEKETRVKTRTPSSKRT